MTPSEFESQLRELVATSQAGAANASCIACTACERCVECTFCSRSKGLLRCHYCVDVERSVSSTHCRASRDLFGCSHCEACERCTQSSYLTRSFDCTGCTYCFGCVGLVGKDFHILNQPYSRSMGSNYTMEQHADARNLPALMIELRQDGVLEPADIADWAARIARGLRVAA